MTKASLQAWLAVAAVAASQVGCGSKGAVSLTAHIESGSVSVTEGPLTAALGADFDLVLELGGSASDETSVQVQSFVLARGEVILVDALSLGASENFPVSLAPGDRKKIHFALEDGAAVDEQQANDICAAAVRIRGTLSDTLSDGKPTPVESTSIDPVCQ